jgi:HSP20 family protein
MFEWNWGYENPLSGQFRRLEQELEQLLGSATLTGTRDIRSLPVGAFPATDVGATAQAVTVYVFVPGLDAKGLDISIRQNLLSIAGKRQLAAAEGATFYRRERFNGEFRRSISLPEDVDPEKVEAKYLDGIVTITIGRRAAAKPRQIQVH